MSHGIGQLSGYEAQKERSRDRQMKLSESGRDIGKMPEIIDPARKERARTDFRYFCEQYHPETFNLGWSPDHLKVTGKIERCALQGGLFALAMPRGSGKSTLSETACEWATLYGHQEYVCLVGADEGHAKDMLQSIKTEIENNDLLLADFPEVCFPIQALEGINQRAKGQLYQGELTRISWKEDQIVFPTIEGSKASACIVEVAGITGRIRGMKFKRPDGRQVRPGMVVVDDPQTDESARSPSQCRTRERVLGQAVLGLAGPGKKIAGIMPCTVISPGDMADNILDQSKYPDWQGERTKLLYEFPKNMKLWERYAKLRHESLILHGDIRDATEFYAEHREAMDEGAVIAWEDRFQSDEISAIQNAMNLYYKDPVAFWSEYQNDPMPEDDVDEDALTAEEIAAKIKPYKQGVVPGTCSTLTAFIDVQGKVLYYGVIAWEEDFTGYMIDYGTYPDQKRPYFTLKEVRTTLKMKHRGTDLEGSIYAGLGVLCDSILGREWKRDTGKGVARVDLCLIDAGWGKSTDVVYQFCRESDYASNLYPSHGQGYGAINTPMNEQKRKRGDRVGSGWKIPIDKGVRAIKHLNYDTNYWKSFILGRLAIAAGDAGCLSLFKPQPGRDHMMLAEHITAEKAVSVSAKGRTVDEFKPLPNRDNHFLDVVVGCAVGAAARGVAVPSMLKPAKKRTKKRIKLSELQRGSR